MVSFFEIPHVYNVSLQNYNNYYEINIVVTKSSIIMNQATRDGRLRASQRERCAKRATWRVHVQLAYNAKRHVLSTPSSAGSSLITAPFTRRRGEFLLNSVTVQYSRYSGGDVSSYATLTCRWRHCRVYLIRKPKSSANTDGHYFPPAGLQGWPTSNSRRAT